MKSASGADSDAEGALFTDLSYAQVSPITFHQKKSSLK